MLRRTEERQVLGLVHAFAPNANNAGGDSIRTLAIVVEERAEKHVSFTGGATRVLAMNNPYRHNTPNRWLKRSPNRQTS